MSDTDAEVVRIAQRLVGDGVAVDLDTDLRRAGLDSLGLVAFMVDLEGRFGISFPSEMVDAATFATPRSAGAAVAAVIRR